MSEPAFHGFLSFMRTYGNDTGIGNCIACHTPPTFTDGKVRQFAAGKQPIVTPGLIAQFKLSEGGYGEASAPVRTASVADRPAASPARALGGRIRAAFSGNAALNAAPDNWEEF